MSGEATISPADRTAWQLTADATGEATDAWKRLPEPAMTGLDAPVGYIPAPATVDAVNVALALGQPLLVTGEPGCGKSALAGWVAHRLGVFPALRFQTRSTATARDLFYMFDAVGRFNAAQNLDANGNRPSIDPRSYITYTGLGAAVLRALPPAERNGLIDPARPDPFGTEPQRSVVLIDEIDKAPRDFPNDVLAELENFAFTIPELRGIAAAAPKAMPPIVIITSNNERALPDAFLRRCLYHNMSFPEAAVLEQIVYARIKAIPVGSRLVQGAIRITETLRSAGLRKQPGIAELLAFILALRARGARSDSAVEIVPRWESDAMITMVKVPGDQARAQAALRARGGARTAGAGVNQTAGGFDGFVAELHAAGYATDPRQIAAAQHLLLLAAAGAWPGAAERLATLLTPIFAQTAAQQADVMTRLERWHARLLSAEAADAPGPPAQPSRAPALAAQRNFPTRQAAATSSRIWRWVLPGATVVLLAIAATPWWLAAPQAPDLTPRRAFVPAQPPPTGPTTLAEGFRVLDGPAVSEPTAISDFHADGRGAPPTWSVLIPVLLGVLPVGVGRLIWFRADRQARRLRRRAAASPRDVAELSVLEPGIPLFEDLASELAGHDLARPRRIAGNEPDIDRSVDATARAAGLGTLVPRERSTTPAYVFVVEETGRHDHLARLSDRLGDRLADSGVHIERYHMSNPRLLRGAAGRISTLEEVARRHPDHRLLLVGPGDVLTDSRGRTLDAALRADMPWADRGFLVAGRIDALTVRLLTEEGFSVAPATPSGLRELGRQIASAPRESGEVLAPLPGTEPTQAMPPNPLAVLEARLSAGYAALAAGDTVQAREAARDARDRAEASGEVHQQAWVMLLQAAIEDSSGDLRRATECARHAAAVLLDDYNFRKTRSGGKLPVSQVAAGAYAEAIALATRFLRRDGQVDGALAVIRSASTKLIEAGGSLAIARVAVETAMAWEAVGQWGLAESELSAALPRLERAHAVWVSSRRAQVLARAKAWGRAIRAAEGSVRRAERLGQPEVLAPALANAVHVGLQAGSRGTRLADTKAASLEAMLAAETPVTAKLIAAEALGDYYLIRKQGSEAAVAFATALQFVPPERSARRLPLIRGLAAAQDLAGDVAGALRTVEEVLDDRSVLHHPFEAARLNLLHAELLLRVDPEMSHVAAKVRTILLTVLTDIERVPPEIRTREGFDAAELGRLWLRLAELQFAADPSIREQSMAYLTNAIARIVQIENSATRSMYKSQFEVLAKRIFATAPDDLEEFLNRQPMTSS